MSCTGDISNKISNKLTEIFTFFGQIRKRAITLHICASAVTNIFSHIPVTSLTKLCTQRLVMTAECVHKKQCITQLEGMLHT